MTRPNRAKREPKPRTVRGRSEGAIVELEAQEPAVEIAFAERLGELVADAWLDGVLTLPELDP